MKIVAVVPDLFFRGKIESAARRAGTAIAFVTPGALVTKLNSEVPDLVLIDLNRTPDATIAAVAELRKTNSQVRVLGFVGHVQVEAQQRAEAAGFTRVVSNGLLDKRLAAIVAGEEP